jgi:predicted enzyme related to lactoylglutathione lyase
MILITKENCMSNKFYNNENNIINGDLIMPKIVHFDVPVDDINRAKKFYEKLFNWKIEKMPGPMEYYEITTTDEKGNDAVDGGMGIRGEPGQGIINYIGVSSVDDYIKKLKELGGKIIMEKTIIPGYGYLATFLDTENNVIGLWETDSNTKM